MINSTSFVTLLKGNKSLWSRVVATPPGAGLSRSCSQHGRPWSDAHRLHPDATTYVISIDLEYDVMIVVVQHSTASIHESGIAR